MKKALFAFIILSLLFATSCKKSNPSNYWSIKGTNYIVDSCVGYGSTLGMTNSVTNVNGFATLDITFPGSSLPVSSGTYTVVNGFTTPAAGQVAIEGSVYGAQGFQILYFSVGGQAVSVSVSPTGKVSVVASGIQIQNNANATDISSFSCNITQTK